MKILFIAGTRPELIKIAPVYIHFKSSTDWDIRLCITGQHREMMQQALQLFDFIPDYQLNLMRPNQSLNGLSSRVLEKIDAVFQSFPPDWIFVQGDTTTAMMSAIAAFHSGIRVAHIEAGLRSYDLSLPWPEEANRKLISTIATLHFAPTIRARDNLIQEGAPASNIFITGNTVIDSLLMTREKMQHNVGLLNRLKERFSFIDPNKKFILFTGHRRESFGEGHAGVFKALEVISRRNDVEVVYPVHLNPQVKNSAYQHLSNLPNVHLIEPVDYLSMIYLLENCYLVLTDSGGIQEEAPTFSKPVLVTRTVTERQEGVEAGTAKLVGVDQGYIISEVERLLGDSEYYRSFASQKNPYGDGSAANCILDVIFNSNVCVGSGGRQVESV